MELRCRCPEGLKVSPTERLMSENSIYTAEECHMLMDLFVYCADDLGGIDLDA